MEEIGIEGEKQLRKTLKFGDIVVNHWASENNPNRKGIFVSHKSKSLYVTDMNGNFWTPAFDSHSKIEIIGSVLAKTDQYTEQIRQERDDYKKALEEIATGRNHFTIEGDIANQALNKYKQQ